MYGNTKEKDNALRKFKGRKQITKNVNLIYHVII